jgi:hypothetical protein
MTSEPNSRPAADGVDDWVLLTDLPPGTEIPAP